MPRCFEAIFCALDTIGKLLLWAYVYRSANSKLFKTVDWLSDKSTRKWKPQIMFFSVWFIPKNQKTVSCKKKDENKWKKNFPSLFS